VSAAPHRGDFQQLDDLVCGHALAKSWPGVTYQAAFITVVQAGTQLRRFEGNSIFWQPEWETAGDIDHSVQVRGGEGAWRVSLGSALYPDLLWADEELHQI
jgi:hypothetical protein